MGAARRLQQEIDLVLKKVKEGVDAFDEIWDKIYDQDNGHQREKLEKNLKEQIKKLQKDRDKIKTWASDKDVRDKKALLDARGTIERRMERFKVCEKEAKTKAFSKAGLVQGSKKDPKEAALEERTEWLRQTVESLQEKVEYNEAEVEAMLANVKRNKEPPARVGEMRDLNTQHKKHIERLEQVQRALDNEAIACEDVDDLKDAIQDYIDNVDDDDDGMYTDVDCLYDEGLLTILDNIEVHVPIAVPERPPMRDSPEPPAVPPAKPEVKKPAATSRDLERERDKQRLDAAQEKEREKASVAAMRAQISGKAPAPGFPAVLEEKAAVAPTPRSPVVTEPPPPPPPRPGTAPSPSSAAASQQTQSIHLSHHSEASSVAPSSVSGAAAPVSAAPSAWAGQQLLAAADGVPPALSPPPEARAPSAISTSAATALSPPPGMQPKPADAAPAGPAAAAAAPEAQAATLAPAASSTGDASNPALLLTQLPPHPFDGVWNHNVCARKARAARVPASYPRVPPAILDSPVLYKSVKEGSEEELFAAFYLTPGTNYQHLAACELKRRNWRFHKQQGAWFRRHEGPHDMAQDYEQGDYIYFDYKLERNTDTWVFRLKQDFTFQYDQLET